MEEGGKGESGLLISDSVPATHYVTVITFRKIYQDVLYREVCQISRFHFEAWNQYERLCIAFSCTMLLKQAWIWALLTPVLCPYIPIYDQIFSSFVR